MGLKSKTKDQGPLCEQWCLHFLDRGSFYVRQLNRGELQPPITISASDPGDHDKLTMMVNPDAPSGLLLAQGRDRTNYQGLIKLDHSIVLIEWST